MIIVVCYFLAIAVAIFGVVVVIVYLLVNLLVLSLSCTVR